MSQPTVSATIAAEWWPLGVLAVTTYVLHLYRRARLTEPPNESHGGFWSELLTWANLDLKRAFGVLLAGLGGIELFARLAGFSLLGLTTLDPVVLSELATVALTALHFFGVTLPTWVWGVVIVSVFAGGAYVGGFWRNRNNRRGK